MLNIQFLGSKRVGKCLSSPPEERGTGRGEVCVFIGKK